MKFELVCRALKREIDGYSTKGTILTTVTFDVLGSRTWGQIEITTERGLEFETGKYYYLEISPPMTREEYESKS